MERDPSVSTMTETLTKSRREKIETIRKTDLEETEGAAVVTEEEEVMTSPEAAEDPVRVEAEEEEKGAVNTEAEVVLVMIDPQRPKNDTL